MSDPVVRSSITARSLPAARRTGNRDAGQTPHQPQVVDCQGRLGRTTGRILWALRASYVMQQLGKEPSKVCTINEANAACSWRRFPKYSLDGRAGRQGCWPVQANPRGRVQGHEIEDDGKHEVCSPSKTARCSLKTPQPKIFVMSARRRRAFDLVGSASLHAAVRGAIKAPAPSQSV